jgi:hypothetical protein
MGQASCMKALQPETQAEINDGESYVNEFNSFTPIMSPRTPKIITNQPFVNNLYKFRNPLILNMLIYTAEQNCKKWRASLSLRSKRPSPN